MTKGLLNLSDCVGDPKFKTAVAFATFLHAVGKMNPAACTANAQTRSLFYGPSDYERQGAEYFRTGDFPLVGDDLRPAGTLQLPAVAAAFGVGMDFLTPIMASIALQGYFLEELKNIKQGKPIDAATIDYVQEVIKRGPPFEGPPLRCWVGMLLIVSISSLQAAQPFGMNRIMGLVPPAQGGPASLNASSEFFPWIANLSKQYRGRDTAQNLEVNTLGFLFANEILSVVDSTYGLVLRKLLNLAYNTAIGDPNVSFAITKKLQIVRDNQNQADAAAAAQPGPVEIVSFTSVAEEAGINVARVHVVETFWEMSLAKLYEPYMRNIARDMEGLQAVDLETLAVGGNLDTRIRSILDALAPVLDIIYKQYSGRQYPNYKLGIPRYNHNSLNHLRSVFFCAQVLLTTTFVELNSIKNSQIFMILLYSFLKSIGRVNERSGSNGPIQYNPNQYVEVFSEEIGAGGGAVAEAGNQSLPPQEAPDVPNLDKYDITSFTSVSSVIQYQILVSIAKKFGLTGDMSYQNSVYNLVVSPYQPNFENFNSNNAAEAKLINTGGMIAVGHYLDHCRPTTGYSQLDSKDKNVGDQIPGDLGTGQPWVTIFLNKWRNPAHFATWLDYKAFLHKKQYDILLATGYSPMGDAAIPIERSSGRRCSAAFSSGLTQEFIDLSYNFGQAWKIMLKNLT